ncbi:hypothetical protein WJX74_003776 [Apatococcus lobatus]|uniref:Smr domain-containing protein n=1 Tax=Apatococcus lobatus TaxID=904363 RepID=A0AAW1S9T8_9CHLO
MAHISGPVQHFVEQCSAPGAEQATTVQEITRVVNDAVHSKPATSDAHVADMLRSVLRTVSMGSEDFESAVTSLLRTISSTSSSEVPADTDPASSPTADASTHLVGSFTALNVNAREFCPCSASAATALEPPAALQQPSHELRHQHDASGADSHTEGWHEEYAERQHWHQGHAPVDDDQEYADTYQCVNSGPDYGNHGEHEEQWSQGWQPHCRYDDGHDQWTHDANWDANGWQAGTYGSDAAPGYHEEAQYWESEGPQDEGHDPFGGVQPAGHHRSEHAGEHWHGHGHQQGLVADLDQSAAIGVLQQQFPAYSETALAELLAISHGNLTATLDVLAQLEMDSETSMPVLDDYTAAKAPEVGQDEFVVDEDNFPALGANAARQPRRDAWSSPPKLDLHAEAPLLQRSRRPGHAQPLSSNKGMPRSRQPGDGLQGQTEVRQEQGGLVTVPWVETGEAVGSLYKQKREDARDHARLRNAFFEQATRAFLAGDKALAKDLGGRGRWHAQQMQAAHASASEAIFAQRNASSKPNGKAPATGKASSLLDFHGLHVTEAQAILKRELLPLKTQSGHKASKVHILVGTGHHTKGSRTPARLPQAVQQFLQENDITYREPQQGLLEVLM